MLSLVGHVDECVWPAGGACAIMFRDSGIGATKRNFLTFPALIWPTEALLERAWAAFEERIVWELDTNENGLVSIDEILASIENEAVSARRRCS